MADIAHAIAIVRLCSVIPIVHNAGDTPNDEKHDIPGTEAPGPCRMTRPLEATTKGPGAWRNG